MLKRIKEFFAKVKNFFSTAVVVISAIDLIMIVIGHLAGLVAITGMAATISIAFILLGMKPELRKKAVVAIADYGLWIDGGLTVILTIYGLLHSVTIGLTAMMIGLNITMLIAICRWFRDNIYNEKPAFSDVQEAEPVFTE